MFKIDFLVDDKHLASVLRDLSGKARDLHVVPVVNVEVKPNGQIDAKHLGTAPQMFAAELRSRKQDTFTSAEAKVLLKELGFSPKSVSSLMYHGKEQHLFTKIGKNKSGRGYTYRLVQPK